jgi:hypothetical protein
MAKMQTNLLKSKPPSGGLFVFFENCNNCGAIVARAANRRPYGI